MCCIRVKFELLKLLDIVGYRYCDEYWFMSPSGCFNHRLFVKPGKSVFFFFKMSESVILTWNGTDKTLDLSLDLG